MDKWQHSLFSESLVPICDPGDYELLQPAIDFFNGDVECENSDVTKACKIRSSNLQRSVLESLMLADDCDNEGISEITGIGMSVVAAYGSLFFRRDAFDSKIDLVDFIETGISYYSDSDDKDSLNLFLLKRWALSLGKEFVIWKFRLQPTEYTADRLYSVVMKEAFFYHKEKSMGNTDISLTEYLRSTSVLLSSVKNSVSIKSSSEEDAGFDILDQLGIIVKEVPAPSITLNSIEGIEFLNNALSQETT